MVGNFAATYLPSDYNPYSSIFTFVLLAVVIRVYGDPLWDMLLQLHGQRPASH